MTLLKTILIFLLVYFGTKLLFKFAKPYIMRYISKKVGEQFGQIFGNPLRTDSSVPPEGNITIDDMPVRNRKNDKKVGEYVDYEEVD